MKVVYTPVGVDLPSMTLGKVYSVHEVIDKHSYWEKYEVVNDRGYSLHIFAHHFTPLEKFRENLIDEILEK